MKRLASALIIVCCVSFFVSGAFGAVKPPRAFSESGTVVKVVDGDTFDLDRRGKVYRIRLIGINTPETKHPTKGVECFGKEASAQAKKLLEGKKVRLEADPNQSSRDKYDRLLRYAWIDGEELFNLMMIEQGYAYEATYDGAYKYQKEFKQAQKTAEKKNKGLWATSACAGKVNKSRTTTKPKTSTKTTTTQQAVCSCSSNSKNCKDFSTHAQAQACFEYCKSQGRGDVHRLDGDNDQRACESLP